jgi:hypothetical protein
MKLYRYKLNYGYIEVLLADNRAAREFLNTLTNSGIMVTSVIEVKKEDQCWLL